MKADKFEIQGEIVMVPIGRLLDNPLNEYLRGTSITPESVEGLSISIKENGVDVPLLISPFRQAFRIVWGHRRRLAAKLAGLTEVPCIIRELDEDAQFTRMLNENIQRANITLLAEARCYRRLEEEGKSLPAIERKTGIGKARIKSLLTILSLEPEVQALFEGEKLTLGCAPHLSRLIERDTQIAVAREAATRGWSVRKLEEKVDAIDKLAEQEATPESGVTQPVAIEGKNGRVPRGRLVDDDGERLTKSEALELFSTEDTFSLQDIKRAILGSCCNTCDEKRFPDLCKECPISQMLATLLDTKSARGKKAMTGATSDNNEQATDRPAMRAA
jgi:ParB family chromosome partitioning protein